jgi:transcriptional regulator with XRE-family HTH domain
MLDGAGSCSLPYPVRRTSHGTINTGTNPGKSPSGLRKKHQPAPVDPMDEATAIDGPKIRSSLDDELFGSLPDFHGGKPPQHDPDAPTVVRGGHAKRTTGQFERKQSGGFDKPGGQKLHRMSSTLTKVFQRRREQIGLSIDQVSKLSGITAQALKAYETAGGPDRLLYDHAVILARVLGVRPQEMPGLRPRENKDDVPGLVGELSRAVLSGPLITFDGRNGERFGGDLDRLTTAPAFALQIGDNSLGDAWPKGSLLSFVAEQPLPGDVTLLRHRRSKLLALRRLTPPTYNGLQPWQPAYVAAGEWMAVGRVQIVLPRLPQQ